VRDLAARHAAEEISDAELLGRYATKRDERAFAALVHRHGPMVLGLCRRVLRNLHDVEDAFQATFTTLAFKAGDIRRGEALAGWLFQVAHRVALAARHNAARRPRSLDTDAPLTAQASPEPLWRDLRPTLDEEVQRLPAKYRLAVVLCYLEGRTTTEAARLLGCPRGTVATRLAWARRRLRARLARRGVVLSAGALAVGLTTPAAAVAPSLVDSTVKAARLVAAGDAAASSLPSMTLARIALRGAAAGKLKMFAGIVVFAGLMAIGVLEAGQRSSRLPAAPEAELAADASPASTIGSPGPQADSSGTWQVRAILSGHKRPVMLLAFSRDGRTLATTGSSKEESDEVRLWDLASVRTRTVLEPGGRVTALAFSPDGDQLLAGIEGMQKPGLVRQWDTSTGQEQATFAGFTRSIDTLTFSPEGRLWASGTQDQAHTPRGIVLKTWTVWPAGSLGFLEVTPAGPPISSADGSLRVLRIGEPGDAGNTIKLWDVLAQDDLCTLQEDPGPLIALARSCDSAMVATLSGRTGQTKIHLWDTTTGKLAVVPRGQAGQTRALALAADGKLLAAAEQGTIQFWDAASGQQAGRARELPGGPQTLVFSHDGSLLVAGCQDGSVRLLARQSHRALNLSR
jgi:RNA polymerase sigma factor (sigma-70 family)